MTRRPNLTIDTAAATASRKRPTKDNARNIRQQQIQRDQNIQQSVNQVAVQPARVSIQTLDNHASSHTAYATGSVEDDGLNTPTMDQGYYELDDTGVHHAYYVDDASDQDSHNYAEHGAFEGSYHSEEDDDAELYDEEDDMSGDFDDSGEESGLSTPKTPDEDISFDHVYALYRFDATQEGQLTVRRDTRLQLLDDSNTYWWLVRTEHDGAVGYIPAENIETPYERLSRLNRSRNVKLLLPKEDDLHPSAKGGGRRGHPPRGLSVKFNAQLAQVTEFIKDANSEDELDLYSSDQMEMDEEDNENDDISLSGEEESTELDKSSKRRDWSRRNKRISDDSLRDQVNGSYDPNNDDEQLSTPLSWTESELDSNTSFDPYSDYVDALSPQMAEYPSACVLRVFAGNLPQAPPYKNVVVTDKTTASAMVKQAVRRFKLEDQQYNEYYISIVTQGSGDYRLNDEDHPIAVLQLVRSQSLAAVRRLSGSGMRSSTASISGIIHQMGLTEQDVHDHTGHDDIFRFYLHKHPSTPITPIVGTPRAVSEALLVKVVAHVVTVDGGVALAKEQEHSREIFEVIGVEATSTVADLANLAQQQCALQDTGNFHVVLSHNEQEETMAPETCVMNVIQGREETAFFVLRGGQGIYTYRFATDSIVSPNITTPTCNDQPSHSHTSSSSSNENQIASIIPQIMLNGTGIPGSNNGSRRSSLSQVPPPITPKSEKRLSAGGKRTSLQGKRTSLQASITANNNNNNNNNNSDNNNNGKVAQRRVSNNPDEVDMMDLYDQYDQYEDETFDQSTEYSDEDSLQQSQTTRNKPTVPRLDSWVIGSDTGSDRFQSPRDSIGSDPDTQRAYAEIKRMSFTGNDGGDYAVPPLLDSSVLESPKQLQQSTVTTTTTETTGNDGVSSRRISQSTGGGPRPDVSSVVRNVFGGIAPPSTPPPAALMAARRTSSASQGPLSPPLPPSGSNSPTLTPRERSMTDPLPQSTTTITSGSSSSSPLDTTAASTSISSIISKSIDSASSVTLQSTSPSTSVSPPSITSTVNTTNTTTTVTTATVVADRADSADSYLSSTRSISTAHTTPAAGSPVLPSLAENALFGAGGFADLLRLTHPATADETNREQAENASRHVANYFARNADTLSSLDQRLEQLMHDLVNVF